MPSTTVVYDLRFDTAFARRIPERLARQAELAIRRRTALVEAKAVKYAPEDTSNLHNSATSKVKGRGLNTTGSVRFTAPYGRFVHEGTGIYGPTKKAYTVRLKKKKALRFKVGGRWVFAKKVTIKGMPGRPFLRRAMQEEAPKLFKDIFG